MTTNYTVMPERQQTAATYDALRHTSGEDPRHGLLLGRTVQAALDQLTCHTTPAHPETLAELLEHRAAQAAAAGYDPVTWTDQVADLGHTHDHLIHS